MGYFEIRVTIDRPLADVFAVYTDTRNWQWSSVFREVSWVKGTPWVEESRMRLITAGPITSTVDQVLTHFEPSREVAYISHFAGITLETRVSFRPSGDRATDIHGRMEFVGTLSRMAGYAVGPAMERSTRQFFDDLKAECERTESGSTPRAVGQSSQP